MNIVIHEYSHYIASEILPLYESVGWIAYTRDPEKLQRAFENSLLSLAAYANNRLVGILRTVGDGETILFIQDLLVHPDYQRKGVGSALIQTAVARFQDIRQIHLVTDNTPETKRFYESLHFYLLEENGCCGLSYRK